ncbi:hypothetical protein WN943_008480 [Citrus x changshan-huyou]
MASDPHNALDIIVQSASLVPVVSVSLVLMVSKPYTDMIAFKIHWHRRVVTIGTKEANNIGTRESDTTGIGCGFTYAESKTEGLQTYAESIVKLVLLEVAAALDSVDVGSESIIKVVLSEAWIVGHSII